MIKMSWEDILKEETYPKGEEWRKKYEGTDVPYELQMGDADESREKALDALGECLEIIHRREEQDYYPYESERRLNPAKRPAKYGSASGKLEMEETHGFIFKIRDMIQEHFINN